MDRKGDFPKDKHPELKKTLKAMVEMTPEGRIIGIKYLVQTDKEQKVVEKAMALLLREVVSA